MIIMLMKIEQLQLLYNQGRIYELGSNHSATVTISDAEDRDRLKSVLETSNQQVLPELFSTTGTQILNAIDGRVQQYFNNNEQNTLVLDGNTAFTNIITSSGGSLANESNSFKGNNWQFIIFVKFV